MKIIIVGAGIAGLAAAIALRKDDREIILLEQSSLSREIGATISLQPNASRIVQRTWNMEDLLSNIATVDEGFQVYGLDAMLQMSVSLHTTEKYGAERLLFHRVDLHEALKLRATSHDFPGRPAKIMLSSRVTGCDCDRGLVKLSDGTQIEGDLVVGADGIKSALRQDVIGRDWPALKTGHSAYRMVIPSEKLETDAAFRKVIDPRRPFTTMVVAHDKRLIMGPARNGEIYSVVAMVPDDTMNEESDSSNWTTPGNIEKMLETFADFPEWTKVPMKLANEAGLWQLRDIDPLPTWYNSRAILIGDAAHAMLPTQGQGASQSIEDAEALGAIYANLETVSAKEVEQRNALVFQCRYDRASLIQQYSRQSAKPATATNSNKVKMNPAEFMDYNCNYAGALEWLRNQRTSAVTGEKNLASSATPQFISVES